MAIMILCMHLYKKLATFFKHKLCTYVHISKHNLHAHVCSLSSFHVVTDLDQWLPDMEFDATKFHELASILHV